MPDGWHCCVTQGPVDAPRCRDGRFRIPIASPPFRRSSRRADDHHVRPARDPLHFGPVGRCRFGVLEVRLIDQKRHLVGRPLDPRVHLVAWRQRPSGIVGIADVDHGRTISPRGLGGHTFEIMRMVWTQRDLHDVEVPRRGVPGHVLEGRVRNHEPRAFPAPHLYGHLKDFGRAGSQHEVICRHIEPLGERGDDAIVAVIGVPIRIGDRIDDGPSCARRQSQRVFVRVQPEGASSTATSWQRNGPRGSQRGRRASRQSGSDKMATLHDQPPVEGPERRPNNRGRGPPWPG